MDTFDFNIDTASRDELVDYIDKLQDTLAKMTEEKDDAEANAADLAIENAELRRRLEFRCPYCGGELRTSQQDGWIYCSICNREWPPYYFDL